MSSRPGRTRRAFSLIEMVTALAISSIIVTALGSTILIATSALPKAAAEQVSEGVLQLDLMMLEISESEQILSATNRNLSFILPDRNGDGQTERVAYSWSGTPGQPLNRSFNGGTAVAVLDAINSLTVSTTTATADLGLSTKISRSRYKNITVALTVNGSSRVLSRTVDLPNAPKILDLWLRTDFDNGIDPTAIDRDYSGSSDFATSGSFNKNKIANGLWEIDTTLNARTPSNINQPTTIAMRLNVEQKDDYARIATVVESSGLTAASLRLTILRRTSDTRYTLEQGTILGWSTLGTNDLPLGAADVILVIEPKANKAILVVNGTEIRSANYAMMSLSASSQVQLARSGSHVMVDWFDVRIGGVAP